MFAFKKKYYLIIENIKNINLRNIKKPNKFVIIYRNHGRREDISDLIKFRKECKLKFVDFYVANDIKLSVILRSDGVYLSSTNKSFKALNLKSSKYKIIGSSHNITEINYKIKQGCDYIFLSKLFMVDYSKDSPFLDVIKFNHYSNLFDNKLVPLGGIKIVNLNKLKIVRCEGFALMSEIKKKPVKIINRLF